MIHSVVENAIKPPNSKLLYFSAIFFCPEDAQDCSTYVGINVMYCFTVFCAVLCTVLDLLQ